MKKTDRAINTALEILDGMVCECGHVESEHLMLTDSSRCNQSRCRCKEFTPVNFHVVRADRTEIR